MTLNINKVRQMYWQFTFDCYSSVQKNFDTLNCVIVKSVIKKCQPTSATSICYNTLSSFWLTHPRWSRGKIVLIFLYRFFPKIVFIGCTTSYLTGDVRNSGICFDLLDKKDCFICNLFILIFRTFINQN